MTFKRFALSGSIALMIASGGALAQDYAPVPRKMPRTPVSRHALPGKTALPPNSAVTGSATVIDSERLKIGDVEMRLFGIVPPGLSASFGPQTRAALDSMTASGATSCTVRDRDREGRYLATCRTPGGIDLALELLRRGLAVTARGSLQPTDLAGPYQAAEQAAQAQKLGLWSVSLPRAVSDAAMREAGVHIEAANAAAQTAPAAQETPAKEGDKALPAKTESKPEAQQEPVTIPVTISAPEKNAKAEASAGAVKPDAVLPLSRRLEENNPALPAAVASAGFFERYQLLLSGVLMLLTVLGIVAAIAAQRFLDRREEVRSIAAALRGELMAARAVCLARLNAKTGEVDEKASAWPRIRTLVFQAYVGRLGLLGAVLARQIASIYGLSSDYAAYYGAAQTGEAKAEPVSKRQALQTLLRHIEEVLPKLVYIEQGTARPKTGFFTQRFTVPPRAAPLHEKTARPAPPAPHEDTENVPPQEVAAAPEPAPSHPAEPLWSTIRRFAAERLERVRKDPMEDHIPDYTAMSESGDMEAMSYDTDFENYEESGEAPSENARNAG